MSTSIPINDLPVTDNARRDGWGHYLIVPPTGGKPVPYTRVTTVAKSLDDGGGLAPWKAAMTASGIIMRRGLRAQWEALLAQYGDPWYAGAEAKATTKKLVEECAAVGGANDGREHGSALHTITALVDLGRSPTHLTEETERDVNAYLEGRAKAGVGIYNDQVELTVVLDKYLVAGTLDRLATVPGFAKPLIADLKTGANLEYSWQSIAVQLAAYSRANSVYVQGPAPDGSDDKRLPMPDVDQGSGLIFWLRAGTGELELHLVNLHAGWEAFEHSMWARGWRKASVNISLADANTAITPDGDLVPILQASLDAAAVTKAAQQLPERGRKPVPTPGTSLVPNLEPVISGDANTNALTGIDQQRAWLQARIDNIGQHPEARGRFVEQWRARGIPTLKSQPVHSPAQLDAIGQLLDDIESEHHLPVPPRGAQIFAFPEPSKQASKQGEP